MAFTLRHDPEADAIYIQLRELPYAYGKDLDHERRIDYAVNGEPIGIEILCVSEGIDTHNLPCEDDVSRLIEDHDLKVYA